MSIKQPDSFISKEEPDALGSGRQRRQFSPGTVTIFGAGIAGLTAAHELVERGFTVIIVEPEANGVGALRVGGMARSQLSVGEPERFRDGAVVPWTPAHDPRAVYGAKEARSRRAQSFIFKPNSFEFDDLHAAWGAAAEMARELVKELSRQGLEASARDLNAVTAYLRVTGWAAPGDVEEPGGQSSSAAYPEPTKVAAGRAMSVSRMLAELLADRLDLEIERLGEELNALANPQKAAQTSEEQESAARDQTQTIKRVEALTSVKTQLAASDRKIVRWITSAGVDPGDCRAVAELAWENEVPLPGEHGYRFFPSFYRHLFDTMKRTPIYQAERETYRTVLDNLIETNAQIFAGALTSSGLTRSRPRSVESFRAEVTKLLCDLEFGAKDIVAFQAKLFRYMTTSTARRAAEYENVSWWEFLTRGGVSYTANFERFIKAAPQALVAMDAETCDARTQGNIVTQLLLDQLLDSEYTDSTLNGPTSDAWLDRWREHLHHQGVTFLPGKLERLEISKRTVEYVGTTEIVSPKVSLRLPGDENNAGTSKAHWKAQIDGSDYYVVATDVVAAEAVTDMLARSSLPQVLPGLPGRVGGVPVQLREFVSYLLTRTDMRIKAGNEAEWDRLLRERRAIAGFPSEYWGHIRNREELPAWAKYAEEQDLRTGRKRFENDSGFVYGLTKHDRFQTFSGVQYYFAHDLEQARGHVYYFDTEWGLSSISQLQFWQEKTQFRKRGLLGLLSVDIGDFRSRSNFLGKAAHECTKEEIAHEVWRQISESLRRGRRARNQEAQRLPLPRPVYFHVDDFISPGQFIQDKTFCTTLTPFLVNNVGDWANRPGSDPWDPGIDGIPADLVDEPNVWQADHGGYQVHYHKLVFAGTYMRTFTRMTTMEAANESARHAVNAILDHLAAVRSVAQKDAAYVYGAWVSEEMRKHLVQNPRLKIPDDIEELMAGVVSSLNKNRLQLPLPLHSIAGDHCKIWNLERLELDDLAFLKRVDEALFAKGLPHMADILSLDAVASNLSPSQTGYEGLLSTLLTTAKKDWAIDDDAIFRGAKSAAAMLAQLKEGLGKLTAELDKASRPPA
jgi:uncharacterized protein with NAD-binding domain and iron-sulfur cluster